MIAYYGSGNDRRQITVLRRISQRNPSICVYRALTEP